MTDGSKSTDQIHPDRMTTVLPLELRILLLNISKFPPSVETEIWGEIKWSVSPSAENKTNGIHRNRGKLIDDIFVFEQWIRNGKLMVIFSPSQSQYNTLIVLKQKTFYLRNDLVFLLYPNFPTWKICKKLYGNISLLLNYNNCLNCISL